MSNLEALEDLRTLMQSICLELKAAGDYIIMSAPKINEAEDCIEAVIFKKSGNEKLELVLTLEGNLSIKDQDNSYTDDFIDLDDLAKNSPEAYVASVVNFIKDHQSADIIDEAITEAIEEDALYADSPIGKTIKIIEMNGELDYEGKEGIVQHIDSIGQLHGTWGGCALIPEVDKYIIIDDIVVPAAETKVIEEDLSDEADLTNIVSAFDDLLQVVDDNDGSKLDNWVAKHKDTLEKVVDNTETTESLTEGLFKWLADKIAVAVANRKLNKTAQLLFDIGSGKYGIDYGYKHQKEVDKLIDDISKLKTKIATLENPQIKKQLQDILSLFNIEPEKEQVNEAVIENPDEGSADYLAAQADKYDDVEKEKAALNQELEIEADPFGLEFSEIEGSPEDVIPIEPEVIDNTPDEDFVIYDTFEDSTSEASDEEIITALNQEFPNIIELNTDEESEDKK